MPAARRSPMMVEMIQTLGSCHSTGALAKGAFYFDAKKKLPQKMSKFSSALRKKNEEERD